MGLFTRHGRKKEGTSPKKVLHIERELPTREETVQFMRDEGLPPQTLETDYSQDGEVRCVIFRSPNGFVTYQFERLMFFDAEEYRRSPLPACWQPFSEAYAKPVYTSLRDLKKQLVFDPEYLTYFSANVS